MRETIPFRERGVPAAYAEFRSDNPPRPIPGSTFARALEPGATIRILDLRDGRTHIDGEPHTRAMVELGVYVRILSVPFAKTMRAGHINVYRQEVRAFSEKGDSACWRTLPPRR